MRIQFPQRVSWPELPQALRSTIESRLGSNVVEATRQIGGFSPGSADLVQLQDGRVVFVKAVDAEVNDFAAQLHAKEANIAAKLPETFPAPKLLSHVQCQGWQALVFAEAPGNRPALPWNPDELLVVLDSVADLNSSVPESLVRGLPRLEDELRDDFAGFSRIIDDDFVPNDPWIAQHLQELHQLAEPAALLLAGEELVHADLRADNILVGNDGDIYLVDWPWAARGAAWYDALTLLIEARLHEPLLDVQSIVDSHRIFASVTSTELVSALAGLTGFYLDAARRPPVPSLPTLRSYHAQQAVACTSWLKELLEN